MFDSLFHRNPAKQKYSIDEVEKPELIRELYPYNKICRVAFDDSFILPHPPEEIFITDTTFRDGQQARPPFTADQIADTYELMHKLGGHSGLIRQCEFFLYSDKDKRAVEACLEKGFKYPEVTGWIRANKDDLKLVRDMGLKETGMLTSVSDYHIFLKLGKTRKQAAEDYLALVEAALDWGIVPRCHFEDITRADIYGFCVPLAQKMMDLSRQKGLPVKIRLCDTMGYGVPYPGASMPRSVAKIVRTFTHEAQVPAKWLEWHGHNDFHKALINATTAWLYGCSGVNATLFGFGERTGNAPLEALIIEYISLTGNDDAAYTPAITELAKYFEKHLNVEIPSNYPFAGRDFNATSAGIHVDGLLKNEEIYNIFNTKHILHRTIPIIITDKTGRAGVAYWINHNLNLSDEQKVDKRHPAVGKIYDKIMRSYAKGRTTNYSHEEMQKLVRRYLPDLFSSSFDQLKILAHKVLANIMRDLAAKPELSTMDKDRIDLVMDDFLREFPFIQYMYITDVNGCLLTWNVSDIGDLSKYRQVPERADLSDREWFHRPVKTGKLHITDFYKSFFTGKLCLTASIPIFTKDDEIVGILGADIRFDELVKIQESLADDQELFLDY
ncbi:triose-phosphate isomerase [Desulfonatronovibrio hydrogenovorans]|uniref:triose-phosphate isomerase n=1 Tax=Desulfonatronovibrio hydrogenovorans TaxID=53245 RepID=UPI0004912150|nr:histone-lysine N-methyltransferase [Desulfonatronovibrio hydrogenovorans]